jgi:hypothetical protein
MAEEKKRLSAVLDERVVPHGRKALKAFDSAETLGAADPAVLAAVLTDGARRGMDEKQSLAMARGYLETVFPPGEVEEPKDTATPRSSGSPTASTWPPLPPEGQAKTE